MGTGRLKRKVVQQKAGIVNDEEISSSDRSRSRFIFRSEANFFPLRTGLLKLCVSPSQAIALAIRVATSITSGVAAS